MGKSRVKSIFQEALAFANERYPLPPLKAEFCPISDQDNALEGRVFGHTGHRKRVVCWAKRAEEELSDSELFGIAFHELGHIIGEQMGDLPGHNLVSKDGKTPQATQLEADEIARQILRVPLYYNERTIQSVAPEFVRGKIFQR